MKLHVAAIIQARMSSSRFPGKVLAPLAGKPLIWHIVHRLRQCKNVDSIVLAVTTNDTDDPLVDFANKEGIKIVRGPEDNVLERYYLAAKTIDADVIVRVTGDVPLIDPVWLDNLVNTLIEKKVDYVSGDPAVASIHEGFSPFTYDALEKLVDKAGADPMAREHVTAYFKEYPGFVSSAFVTPDLDYQFKGARISVDTPADLQFIEKIYSRLQVPAGDADVREVVKLLRREPELLQINAHVYQKRADEITRQALFRCDGGSNIGFGHIFRCLALADQLREHFGFGVTFAMAKDTNGFESVQKAGYKVDLIDYEKEEESLGQLVKSINPDVLIFDSLSELDNQVLDSWREEGLLILTVDDPTNKRLSADLVFYPPVPQVQDMSWDGFTGELFSGWQWVLLRQEFVDCRNNRSSDQTGKPAVLVTMGGSDPKGLTLKAVEALEDLDQNIRVLVLIGPGFSHKERIEVKLKRSQLQYRVYKNYSEPGCLFAKADLAVASFGVTAYELAATGVPSVLLGISEDHALSASVFESAGIGINLGCYSSVEKNTLAEAVKKLLNDHGLRKKMSEQALKQVDGRGVQRIAKIIRERLQ